jgi:hypothetical protein
MDPSPDASEKTSSLTSAAAVSVTLAPDAGACAESPVAAVAAVGAVAGETKQLEKPKGKRTTLSLHDKFIVKTFCEQQINDSKARADFVPSHDALRQEIAAKFGWEVGRSTLSKIMCMDWQQLQVHGHPNPTMKRKRKPLFPAFEDDLVKSMRAHLARQESAASQSMPSLSDGSESAGLGGARTGPFLTEAFIMEEAQRLKQQHGIKDEELVLSVGWLARFKHRHGIRLRKGTVAAAVDTGEAAAIAAAMLPVTALHIGDALNNKRLKKNMIGMSSRWPTSFQFPSPYNAMELAGDTRGLVDQPFPVLASLSDLRTTCTFHATAEESAVASDPAELVPAALFENVPMAVLPFACPHCPASLPLGIEGLHVVVVGFNCVHDAFIAAALVGEHGSVVCIETNATTAATAMDQVETYTLKTLGYAAVNLRILSTASLDHSVYSDLVARQDVVYFNCSFQSAVHKAHLLEVAFHLLQEGGECRLSYVSSSRRLSPPPSLQPASLGLDGLFSASVYTEDFRRMCQHVGFLDPRCLRVRKYASQEYAHGEYHHPVELGITTVRLFKLGLVEDRPEDYGERATLVGDASGDSSSSPAAALVYRLDAQFTFMRGVSVAVDGNTSQILRLGWLKNIFSVEGDRLTHRGRFTSSL